MAAEILSIGPIQLNEEATIESLTGLTQRMVSTKVDQANQTLLSSKFLEAGEREVARSQWRGREFVIGRVSESCTKLFLVLQGMRGSVAGPRQFDSQCF